MLRAGWTSVKFVAVAVPASLLFLDNVGSVARVHGSSMMPTLQGDRRGGGRRDYVWLNTFAVRRFQVERGDVVVFSSPTDPSKILIKRVTALEGDVVHSPTYKQNYVLIKRGYMWMEGDNKEMSMDSHNFGQISRGLLLGKVEYIIWPPQRWGRVKALPETVATNAKVTKRTMADLAGGVLEDLENPGSGHIVSIAAECK
ncbi:putative Mitochondrial inner membrane protease subunit 2 [Hypsibius exemplaris]|uniref:Mitochondrial inner membrane protease subunit n=1 Tax=Hypsibius exemplaris TaxID=2072580 RepID=A0A1W0WVI3_HYPEX|nr:putative Mitochondrial inner membrane protease subunit 2 [Hypsibius exemplaris]